MLKRLGLGLLKGLALGAAIGAAFHFGLGVTAVGAFVGFLLAMLTGLVGGVLSGKPPWKKGAWIESLLKGAVGTGVGALLYWLATAFVSFKLPFALGAIPAGTAWTAAPLLFAPAIAGVWAALVELDNTGDAEEAAPTEPAGAKKKAAANVRVAIDDDEEEQVASRAERKAAKRRA